MSSILVVDDDPAHRLLTKRFIRTRFAEDSLIEAGSVAESKILISKGMSDLTVVVLDLNLGTESGLSTLQWIRDNPATRDIPVIMVSTSGLEADVYSSYAHGADCYIMKNDNQEQYQNELVRAIEFCRRPAP